nr:hypothetical protein [Kouleothrix sp.]
NVRDDLWEVSGQAYRMAARPIISQGRYYVGAIVHGMALNDAYANTVAQLVPGARLDAVPESGHLPHQEQPARVLELLEEALTK